MTYSLRNVLGVVNLSKGKQVPTALFLTSYDLWPRWAQKVYDYVIACHVAHLLDFAAALLCYFLIFPDTFAAAKEGFHMKWIAKIIGFNLAIEFLLYGFWHHMMYASASYAPHVKGHKFNSVNQYETTKKVGYFSSTSGHLQREILLTTVGFLISSCYQIVITYLWAKGYVPCYLNFWEYPAYSIGWLLFVTYWREFHFYWVHRGIHPWWSTKNGLAQGDIGAFLYRWCHSWHHKSYNPGPWAGLSMHPVEHLIYYTCTLTCLLIPQHPLHFLYAKFHADIAPIGGHDGFGDPGGNSDYHYLHHKKFEVNYGVPLFDFDRLFGTWMDYTPENKKK